MSSAEVFMDGLTTYWVTADLRLPEEAVAMVAGVAGPFQSWIKVDLVAGRIEDTTDGPKFTLDVEGDVECWQVDAE